MAVTQHQKPETGNRVVLFVIAVMVGCMLACGVLVIMGLLSPSSVPGFIIAWFPQSSSDSIIIVLPTPQPGNPAVTATVDLNVRSGPGVQYPIIGYLPDGKTAEVVGVSPDGGWWVINVPDAPNKQGWVSSKYVIAEYTDGVPVIQPPPVPALTLAPPQAFVGWKGEYFNNRDLYGLPALVRDDEAIDFDWGHGSPAREIQEDNFSARWTISREVPTGNYRFSVWVDDGVRVWVNNQLIINGWVEGVPRNYVADVNVEQGKHEVRVEFFEATGSALCIVNVSSLTEYPDWKAEYFGNPNVDGQPVVVRNEAEINHNWGSGEPAPGVGSNNFSGRWSRKAYFESGSYRLQVELQGGTQVWLDGVTRINDWVSGDRRSLTADVANVGQGWHDLRVDYFKSRGNGQIRFGWTRQDEGGPPKATISGTTRAQVGQAVNLNARQSSASQGSHLVAYDWTFGDGAKASGVDVTHVYDKPGSYDATLTVTDDRARTNTTAHRIDVKGGPTATPEPGTPPTAVISGPSSGRVDQVLTFDGTQSHGDRPIARYEWDLGDGTIGNTPVLQHAYSTGGGYQVTLTVTDDRGQQGVTRLTVHISQTEPTPTARPTSVPPTEQPQPTAEPSPPVAVISAPQEAVVNMPVVLDGSQSSGVNPIVSFSWLLGDNTASDGVRVEHVYSDPGTYQVTLTVTDQDGLQGRSQVQIEVKQVEPGPLRE